MEKYPLKNVLPKVPSIIRHILTLFLVILGWILFRSDSAAQAVLYYKAMFGGSGFSSIQAVYYLREYCPEFVCCLLAAFPVSRVLKDRFLGSGKPWMRTACSVLSMAFASLVFLLSYMQLEYGGFNPFIYFQF